jgi:hypothetical protein
MDWPKAREIGERLQEMLPPPIKQKLEQEQQEREQASGKPPKPPSPQEQQQMAAWLHRPSRSRKPCKSRKSL